MCHVRPDFLFLRRCVSFILFLCFHTTRNSPNHRQKLLKKDHARFRRKKKKCHTVYIYNYYILVNFFFSFTQTNRSAFHSFFQWYTTRKSSLCLILMDTTGHQATTWKSSLLFDMTRYASVFIRNHLSWLFFINTLYLVLWMKRKMTCLTYFRDRISLLPNISNQIMLRSNHRTTGGLEITEENLLVQYKLTFSRHDDIVRLNLEWRHAIVSCCATESKTFSISSCYSLQIFMSVEKKGFFSSFPVTSCYDEGETLGSFSSPEGYGLDVPVHGQGEQETGGADRQIFSKG